MVIIKNLKKDNKFYEKNKIKKQKIRLIIVACMGSNFNENVFSRKMYRKIKNVSYNAK